MSRKMAKFRVLIVGASIAGPTAAYWFARAGAAVTVIERFPQLRANGQNVDIRTVGVTVMRKMPGMESAVRSKLSPMAGISFVGDDGRPYGTIRSTGNPDQQSLVSEYEILRGDLGQILYDMTKDNSSIRYIFGEQVASIRQHELGDGPVTVEFANGLPSSDFDLVVACDGATSRTRAIGLDCTVRDHITPMNCWAAYFTVQQDILNGSDMGHAYSAPGGRFMAIGSDPSGVNRVVFMGIYPRDEHDAARPFRDAMKRGEDELKKFVAEHYQGAGWKCDKVIKGMMEAEDFYGSEIVKVNVPKLYNGQFVLVGDAGYGGAAGSGTSLAIAGAYVLAGEICRHGDDLVAGLQAYEEQMRPVIDDLQKTPPLFPGILAPQTAWGIWLRNCIFALISRTRILEIGQRFFSGSFANIGKYKLPEYEWAA